MFFFIVFFSVISSYCFSCSFTLFLSFLFCSKTCIDYGKFTVAYFSFGTSFATKGLVDTYTIKAWCRKLSLDTKPKDSKVHHFFTLFLWVQLHFFYVSIFLFILYYCFSLWKFTNCFVHNEHLLFMGSYETQELYDQKSSMVQRCFQLANGARLIHSCDEVNTVKCVHF